MSQSHQNKVQGYLHKHNIANLFEVMMSSLVKEMPADPYELMLSMITHQKHKMAKQATALDVGELKSSASVWGSFADRSYDKPWRANTKAQKSKKLSLSVGKQDWNHTVKLATKSFDELNLAKAAKKSPDVLTQGDDPFMSTSERSAECHMTEEELLSEELPTLSKYTESADDDSPSLQTDVRTHPKLKGPKADSLRHQTELAEFLLAKKAKVAAAGDADSGVVDGGSDDEAGKMTLYENPADLEDEGVVVKGDKSANQVWGVAAGSYTKPVIQVSVCAQCAKVISGRASEVSSITSSSLSLGNQLSSKKTSSRAGDFTTRSNNPNQKALGEREGKDVSPMSRRQRASDPAQAAPTTGRTGFSSYYAGDEDDEFESVSQVSGEKPRIPVWADSDDEGISPVKGSHMLHSPRLSKSSKPDRSRLKGHRSMIGPSGKPLDINFEKEVPRCESQQSMLSEQLEDQARFGRVEKGGRRRDHRGVEASTLKADLLRQLPDSANTVEEFLGNNTWSGEEARVFRRHAGFSAAGADRSRISPRARDVMRQPQSVSNRRSYDTLGEDNSRGWNLNYNTEDDSTVVP